ncbi:alkylated DNA repair protein alkB 6 [Polychytrium aggregatum]|uniref:alkylated DNA repair protein alkB 6 n=1 Tax=Polychytrium aggregatum TaxID=110093 RepID=UPI0022FE1A48|nr:alkylated DNA repair protein alkB 6 [Polychytrium aggregatum]KAI9202326.1 alkylated DNA repair protein alkB 6 [Polychytrium aggregatum]
MITDVENQVPGTPPSLYYIREFITVEQEQELLAQVYAAPKPKWTTLKNRRLQNWGATPSGKQLVGLPEDLPGWLTRLAGQLGQVGSFTEDMRPPNHCLVNEYLPGQGIMPHEDGPAYYPTVATVSLGSHCVLNFYRRRCDGSPEASSMLDDPIGSEQRTPEFSVWVEPRSLLVLKDQVYTAYLHGIDPIETDRRAGCINLPPGPEANDEAECRRETRVSLTFRLTQRVMKSKLFALGKRL